MRSTDIREAISRGDLERARLLLGRPIGLRGEGHDGRVTFEWPMAMPPDGEYAVRIEGRRTSATVEGATVRVPEGTADGTVRVEFMP